MDLTGMDKLTLETMTIDEDLFYYNNNLRYKLYEKEKEENLQELVRREEQEGKVHLYYQDGKKEIIFDSGIHKEVLKKKILILQIYTDGYTVVHFINNDVKQLFPNGVVVYYFDDAHATQTTLPNG